MDRRSKETTKTKDQKTSKETYSTQEETTYSARTGEEMSEGITLPATQLYEVLSSRVFNKIKDSPLYRVRIPMEPLDWLNQTHHPADVSLIVSSKSITDLTNKVKYVYQWPFTYGELAVEYINLCLEEYDEIPKHKEIKPVPPPLFFNGPTRGTFAYVDIQACHFSFYRYVGLDAFYDDKMFSVGKIPFLYTDELALSKLLRNTVLGILQHRTRTRYKNNKFYFTEERTPYYFPRVAHYVLSSLQAVAQEAVRLFPIHQWLTDAAIIEASASTDFIDWLWEEWRLLGIVQSHGPAYSFSVAAYHFPNKYSRGLEDMPFYNRSVTTFKPINIPYLKLIRKEVLNESLSKVIYTHTHVY